MRMMRLAFATALLLAGSRVALAGEVAVGGPFGLKSLASGKCLDVSQAQAANGQPVLLWECHGGTNQLWYVRAAEGSQPPTWAIHSALDQNKCLDVAQQGGAGTRLVLWDCHGGANQRFASPSATPAPDGHEYRSFAVAHNGLCLDVQGNARDDGTPIIVWTCSDGGAPNQLWSEWAQ